jgi:hypothetical protein
MMETKYRVYPTLLNAFGKYLASPSEMAKLELLNRINRVPDFDTDTLSKLKKGISFEHAVLKNTMHRFDPAHIEAVRELLPKRNVTQKKVSFNHHSIHFYGIADVVGEGRVIDLKTTSRYKSGKFSYNFQTLYLFALKNAGCHTMEYIVYDFENIYIEKYTLENIDFGLMLHQMEWFAEFLDQNRPLIKDKKIFIEASEYDLFR